MGPLGAQLELQIYSFDFTRIDTRLAIARSKKVTSITSEEVREVSLQKCFNCQFSVDYVPLSPYY